MPPSLGCIRWPNGTPGGSPKQDRRALFQSHTMAPNTIAEQARSPLEQIAAHTHALMAGRAAVRLEHLNAALPLRADGIGFATQIRITAWAAFSGATGSLWYVFVGWHGELNDGA